MKHKLLISFSLLALFITMTASIMSDDGRAGATGSPGETTCNTSQCHNSFALNSGSGVMTATSTMNNWEYLPFTTYTITVKIVYIGRHIFGTGIEMLTSSNTNAGTITITDAVHTTTKNATIAGVSRKSVVHKENGGAFTDSASFTFNWTSPDTTTGPITMYYACNATNANGMATGDYIYTANRVCNPESGVCIKNLLTSDSFSMYPIPAQGTINLHYTLQRNETVEVKMYDMSGAEQFVLLKSEQLAGENNHSISLPENCKSGNYILSIESPSGRVTKKFIVL